MKRFFNAALLVLAAVAAVGMMATASAGEKLRVGYIVNDMSHEWYQNIANGAKRRAADKGVTITVVDATMDAGKQISQAENLMASGIDVLVLSPVDSKALVGLIGDARDAGIKVICEANMIPGADTYVGISNLAAGKKAGAWFADYAAKNKIDPKVLIVGFPNYEDCRQRVDGFKAALQEAGLKYNVVQEVDSQGSKETALRVAADALTAHRDANVIFGINDNSTTGGMNAYKESGLDESKLTAIGFGFEGVVGREALLGNTPYKAALAMFPDYVGASLVDAAISLHAGEKLPEHFETPTIMITRENFPTFYKDNGDGTYTTDFAAIDALKK